MPVQRIWIWSSSGISSRLAKEKNSWLLKGQLITLCSVVFSIEAPSTLRQLGVSPVRTHFPRGPVQSEFGALLG
jgi:hypothetical protein